MQISNHNANTSTNLEYIYSTTATTAAVRNRLQYKLVTEDTRS